VKKLLLTLLTGISLVLVSGLLVTTQADVFQAGADRLVSLQNNDGGWDWPLNDGNPNNASPTNTIGPIAMGLAKAYLQTGDPNHLLGLQNASAFLTSKTVFSPSDGYLAVELDSILGGTTNVDYVKANFYDRLAAGTFLRSGVYYDTEGYVNLIRTNRASQGIANLAAWDIGVGLYAANRIGASTTAWLSGTKAEIDELDGSAYYDVIGLSGAVLGLASVGEDYTPTAGEHLGVVGTSGLADALLGYQLSTGGFTWNSLYMGEGEDNETVQETAYSILALNRVDQAGYWSNMLNAASYLQSVQLPTGGWANYNGGGENNEVTAEALWGIATAPEPVSSALFLVGAATMGVRGYLRRKKR